MLLRRVVISDRHAYDIEIGFHNTTITRGRKLRAFLARLAPSPHITIFLDNDASVIWARKKEYPLDTIESALLRYREIAKLHKMHIIRTDLPSDQIVREFLSCHWRGIINLRRDRIRFPFVAR